MKVIHILDNLGRGGMETLILDICRNAAKYGMDLMIVLTGDGVLLEDFLHSGAKVKVIRRTKSLDLRVILTLRKIIKKNDINIIHTHEAVTSLHAYIASIGLNVKNVMSIHGHIKKRADNLLSRLLVNMMDINIVVSDAFLKSLAYDDNYNTYKNFYVLHNAIDCERIKTEDNTFRSELNLKETDILIGMIGNFYSSGRDQLTICKMLPSLFERYPSAYFVFAGGRSSKYPSYFDECFDLCEKANILARVFFVGHRKDVSRILAALDIFVYSSNHDSFGISVIEAIIAGKPVLINDLPSLMEITDNGKYVNVFLTRDANNLLCELTKIIENFPAAREQSIRAQQWALKQYSIENHLYNLQSIYSSVLNSSHN